MKKCLLIMLCFTCGLCTLSAKCLENEEEEEKVIVSIHEEYLPDKKDHRSLYLVEAYLFRDCQTVEVSLCSIGTASVYVLNSNEEVVDSLTTSTNNVTVVCLNTLGEGNYRLIIESDSIYAEGQFTI